YYTKTPARETTSPSMDISKASNFERYVLDLAGRDGAMVRELWRRLEAEGELDLTGTPLYARVAETGCVSGRRTHADRITTIRRGAEKYGVFIDPHPADGVKVGLELGAPGGPLASLERALPAKSAAPFRQALGRVPARPAELADLESRPQRFEV